MANSKVILIIRDGWGCTEEIKGNAVYLANTPNNERYMNIYPWTLLTCTGNAVGLPEGTQGGSEPGHLTMGAGRIIRQPLKEINEAILDGSFYRNSVLLSAVRKNRKNKGKLHLIGLLSDQGIHGTTHHLYALLELARREKLETAYIHCFLDGRDVPEKSAKRFLSETLKKTNEKGFGQIASLIGRYYSMDRDNNWDRIQKAYDLLTLGVGYKEGDVFEALDNTYKRENKSDYYVKPIVMVNNSLKPIATIDDSDSVIFWNYRSDRARQITQALTQRDFDNFPRRKIPNILFTCMSMYDKNLDLAVAFPQKKVQHNLGQTISEHGLKQLRVSETEKYAHVTYFFNSQVEKPYLGESRILVPSLKIPNYEEKPEMSTFEINRKLIPEISSRKHNFILVNYANGDLVGHSANLCAGIKACETVDQCVGEVVDTGLKNGYVILVTGDHGNVETMLYPDGTPNPSHGMNPVPFILISDDPKLKNSRLRKGFGLGSIAPTILFLMGLKKPHEMTGENIIV
ncbi:MAG: 2,3-bisphosphoglycerate-independent phosphoglycerate mutase [Candidatus Thorarchaeota archaeon]